MNGLISRLEQGDVPAFDDWREALSKTIPLLDALADTPQEPEWHGEGDVAIHTGMVLEALEPLLGDETPERRIVLGLAALLHDIAKPLVTREVEIDGRTCIAAPGHARVGRSRLVPLLLEPELGLAWPRIARVLALVGHHHDLRRIERAARRDDRYAAGAALAVATLVEPDLLLVLERADILGRICGDQSELLEVLDTAALGFGLARERLPDVAAHRAEVAAAVGPRDDHLTTLATARAHRAMEAGRIGSVDEGLAMTWGLRERRIPRLTLTVGCSGSGKSSWAAERDEQVVSLDEIRAETTGRRTDQRANRAVLQTARERVRDALRARSDVTLDATSLRRDGRRWFASLASDYDAAFRLVAFPQAASVLRARNRARRHPVPGDVLERQIERSEWPTAAECDEMVWCPLYGLDSAR